MKEEEEYYEDEENDTGTVRSSRMILYGIIALVAAAIGVYALICESSGYCPLNLMQVLFRR